MKHVSVDVLEWRKEKIIPFYTGLRIISDWQALLNAENRIKQTRNLRLS